MTERNPADVLLRYVQHENDCDLRGHWMQAAECGCTCGLSEAIAALQQSRSAVIEECAKVAEEYPSPMNDLPMALAMRSVASAIRALSQEQTHDRT